MLRCPFPDLGDLEGLYPTSNCFSRYPLRELVLAASLAWRGDSVTGVDANYHPRSDLSTPFGNSDLNLA